MTPVFEEEPSPNFATLDTMSFGQEIGRKTQVMKRSWSKRTAKDEFLVTLDKDFGEIAVSQGAKHHGILRISGYSARQQGSVCAEVVARHGDELLAGAIITAELGRLRIRSAEPPHES